MSYETLPSLENLRCFLAAAEQLNFRKASAIVHLTPAAFGSRIKQLESTLGCALFVRSTRTMSLTAEGERLIPQARETIAGAMRCAHVTNAERKLPVRLILGTRFELGLSWLLPALLGRPAELEHIECDLRFGHGTSLSQDLRRGSLDGIITSKPESDRAWQSEFLHRETYSFVASASTLVRLPLSCVEDAKVHTLLDIDETLPLTRYLTSVLPQPLTFAKVRGFGTIAAIEQGVRAGVGVGVLPTYLVEASLARGELVEIFPETALLSDSFRIIYSTHAIHREAMAQLAIYLRQRPLG